MGKKPQTFIEGMRKAGQLACDTLHYIKPFIKEGINTEAINTQVHEYTLSQGAIPAPLGYNGFPKSVCTSVNQCVCHGVPSKKEILKAGDIINVDVTSILNGYHGDTSATFFVGEVSSEVAQLTEVAYHAMHKGIEQVIAGVSVGSIGFAINKYVSRKGFFVVKEIGGHGIGLKFHEDPFVPSIGKKGKGYQVKPWTCITVEPMVNLASSAIEEFSISQSTVKYYETQDKTPSAQFEHTVLVTDTGYEIMTLSSNGEVVSF